MQWDEAWGLLAIAPQVKGPISTGVGPMYIAQLLACMDAVATLVCVLACWRVATAMCSEHACAPDMGLAHTQHNTSERGAGDWMLPRDAPLDVLSKPSTRAKKIARRSTVRIAALSRAGIEAPQATQRSHSKVRSHHRMA
jgi:hypothetical protein